MRTCTKCNKAKEDEEFYKVTGYTTRQSWCIQCTKRLSSENFAKLKARSPEHLLYRAAKARAKSKGLDFDIDISDIKIPEYCPVTLLKLEVSKRQPSSTSPTLDRIDSSKGYIKGNIAVISHRANTTKRDLTIEDVERLLAYMKQAKGD